MLFLCFFFHSVKCAEPVHGDLLLNIEMGGSLNTRLHNSHGGLTLCSPEILKTVYRVLRWKAIPKLYVKVLCHQILELQTDA